MVGRFVLSLALVGCTFVTPPEPAPPLSSAQAEAYVKARENAHAAEVKASYEDAQSRMDLRHAATEEELANARRLEARAKATACDLDRPEREQEMQKTLTSRARKRELEDWEFDHCKTVDHSRPVVRTVQDARGEYHTYEGRDRGVDRECDAKKPPELKTTYARNVQVYAPPRRLEERNATCRDLDLEISPVASAYWLMPIRQMVVRPPASDGMGF